MQEILAENLRALMNRFPSLGTQAKVAAATNGKIDQKTVSRVLRKANGTTMTTVNALAEAFDIAPYQLLIPDLDPKNPQIVKTASAAERKLWAAMEELRQEQDDMK